MMAIERNATKLSARFVVHPHLAVSGATGSKHLPHGGAPRVGRASSHGERIDPAVGHGDDCRHRFPRAPVSPVSPEPGSGRGRRRRAPGGGLGPSSGSSRLPVSKNVKGCCGGPCDRRHAERKNWKNSSRKTYAGSSSRCGASLVVTIAAPRVCCRRATQRPLEHQTSTPSHEPRKDRPCCPGETVPRERGQPEMVHRASRLRSARCSRSSTRPSSTSHSQRCRRRSARAANR